MLSQKVCSVTWHPRPQPEVQSAEHGVWSDARLRDVSILKHPRLGQQIRSAQVSIIGLLCPKVLQRTFLVESTAVSLLLSVLAILQAF